MGLIDKKVKVKWSKTNKRHYVDLGYKFTKNGEEFEVNASELTKSSKIKIEYICDKCGEKVTCCYDNYARRVDENGNIYCQKCVKKEYAENRRTKDLLKKKKSFYEWCLETNNEDILHRWDYELNNCDPKDVIYSVCKKYWFKCDKHPDHKSELKNIGSFAIGNKGVMTCSQCNSFEQWCIDNNRQDILDSWEYELNNCKPIDVPRGTSKKYWFRCYSNDKYEIKQKSILTITKGNCNVNIKYKSFKQWCDENDRHDVILRWDYEMNGCDPEDISYATSKKFWFKCENNSSHRSELKRISNFTCRKRSNIGCIQCGSIAQWFIDNNLKLEDYWDFEKNENLDSWKIAKSSGNKVWIKCQEKEYHDSYEVRCSDFIRGDRCPYCAGKRIHPKDSFGQYIVDNYGEDFLNKIWSDKNEESPYNYSPGSKRKAWWKCLDGKHDDFLRDVGGSINKDFRCPTCSKNIYSSILEKKTKKYLKELGYEVETEKNCSIKPINPKTGCVMPFDNEIELSNGKRLIIEVHGQQHYENNFYKTLLKMNEEDANKQLRKRKVYDRYKKAYAEHYGYEYLELPYYLFGKDDKYKEVIDQKINEILSKNVQIKY